MSFKKDATILFCDIRNFTSLFDDKDPNEAVAFANSVLSVLGDTVEQHGGVVDRFTGDGFLAHFGILDESADHARSACLAAIALRATLNGINAQRYFKTESVVGIGIGIHSGPTAYARIRTSRLEQDTVLGDTVNTAARIEELTKHYLVDVLLSENAYLRVADSFKFMEMGSRKLRGKKEDARLFWLLPMNL